MRKALSSCYDCILLRDHPNPELKGTAFWCAGYNKPLTYDVARTPNDCTRKKRSEEDVVVQFPREEILARFYATCCDFAEQIGRPFTMKELFEHVDYMNKNSLWELMEILVKTGKLEKASGKIRTWAQVIYPVKTYWPLEWTDANTRQGNGTSLLRK